MLIGLIGSAIPLLLLRFLYIKVVSFVTAQFSVLSNLLVFLPVNDVFRILIPATLIIGLGIGLIGSYLTLARRLRV